MANSRQPPIATTGFLAGVVLGALLAALPARADVAVIAHPESPVRALTPGEVSDLYLGRTRQLGSGGGATIFEHERDASLRARFFRSLNGMDVKQLNSYWARLQFSGQTLPPRVVSDSRSMLHMVRSNRNALGYVDAADADGSVRVVLLLKETPR